jgi:hypothetical protein
MRSDVQNLHIASFAHDEGRRTSVLKHAFSAAIDALRLNYPEFPEGCVRLNLARQSRPDVFIDGSNIILEPVATDACRVATMHERISRRLPQLCESHLIPLRSSLGDVVNQLNAGSFDEMKAAPAGATNTDERLTRAPNRSRHPC